MKKVNLPMLLLAILVVLMFCLVGVAVYHGSALLIILFLILGFALMGYGLMLKRKSDY